MLNANKLSLLSEAAAIVECACKPESRLGTTGLVSKADGMTSTSDSGSCKKLSTTLWQHNQSSLTGLSTVNMARRTVETQTAQSAHTAAPNEAIAGNLVSLSSSLALANQCSPTQNRLNALLVDGNCLTQLHAAIPFQTGNGVILFAAPYQLSLATSSDLPCESSSVNNSNVGRQAAQPSSSTVCQAVVDESLSARCTQVYDVEHNLLNRPYKKRIVVRAFSDVTAERRNHAHAAPVAQTCAPTVASPCAGPGPVSGPGCSYAYAFGPSRRRVLATPGAARSQSPFFGSARSGASSPCSSISRSDSCTNLQSACNGDALNEFGGLSIGSTTPTSGSSGYVTSKSKSSVVIVNVDTDEQIDEHFARSFAQHSKAEVKRTGSCPQTLKRAAPASPPTSRTAANVYYRLDDDSLPSTGKHDAVQVDEHFRKALGLSWTSSEKITADSLVCSDIEVTHF